MQPFTTEENIFFRNFRASFSSTKRKAWTTKRFESGTRRSIWSRYVAESRIHVDYWLIARFEIQNVLYTVIKLRRKFDIYSRNYKHFNYLLISYLGKIWKSPGIVFDSISFYTFHTYMGHFGVENRTLYNTGSYKEFDFQLRKFPRQRWDFVENLQAYS